MNRTRIGKYPKDSVEYGPVISSLGARLFRRMNLPSESEIIYRDFWDVPRIFIVRHEKRQYLFDCRFNESGEDFEEAYRVYLLPDLPESELNGSWEGLAERALSYLGQVPVKSVSFDPSRRRTIDTHIIDELKNNAGGNALR